MANTAVIDFLFNSQGAMRGISEFQTKLQKSVDTIVKSTAAKMGALGTALIGFSSVKSMISEVREVSDFATLYGKNVEQVSRFNNVMAQFGSSTNETLATYGKLQDSLKDLRINAAGAYKELATRLQMNFFDEATGKWKDGATILQELRKRWSGLGELAKIDALDKLGINTPAVRRYLDATTSEMAHANEIASKMPAITEKQVATLRRLDRSLSVIKASFMQIGAVILEKLEKPIEWLAKGAEWLSSQSDTVRGSIVGVVAALGMIAPILSVLKTLLTPFKFLLTPFFWLGKGILLTIAHGLAAISVVIEGLFSLLLANPILLVIAAVAAAAYLIYKNWDAIKAYFGKFVNWVTGLASRIGDVFKDIFNSVVEWIKNILSKIPVIGKMINDELKSSESDVELKQSVSPSSMQQPFTPMSMLPRGAMLSAGNTTNNNQQSKVTNTYNVTFNGVSNPDEINNKFTQVVRQGTTGVR